MYDVTVTFYGEQSREAVIYRPSNWGYGSSVTIIVNVELLISQLYVDIKDAFGNILMGSTLRHFLQELEMTSVINKKKEEPKTIPKVSELKKGREINFTLQLRENCYKVFVEGSQRYCFTHRLKVLPALFTIYGEWVVHNVTFYIAGQN